MNILSGIIGGVKAIFGAGQSGTDNVMKVASGIGSWIDNKSFTEQEKATMNSEVIVPAFQKFMDSTVAENTERSRTRREIAIWVIRAWVILLFLSIATYGVELVIKATQHEMSGFVLGIVTLPTMDYLVLGVGAFFFGAHIVRQVKGQ